MLRAAEVVADLEDDKVPADEHVVEIVRVDLEQDRGHSNQQPLSPLLDPLQMRFCFASQIL